MSADETELMPTATDDEVFERFYRGFIADGLDDETAREAAEDVCRMRREGVV